jgi:hypothetical protein
MNRGYLTLAQNGTHDYVRMAYVLAMSLKLSQGLDAKLSVIVNENEEIPSNYAHMFDKIIKVAVPEDEWKVQNKWMYFDLTPYDETIVLDADMLFLTNHDWWWDFCFVDDLLFCERALNFKGDETDSDYYRKVFTENSLPNHYTALFYFKKNKENEKYFQLIRLIFENWKEWYNHILKNPPKHVSGDVVYSMASKIMFRNNMKAISPFMRLVHMRNKLQDSKLSGDWTKTLRCDFINQEHNILLKVNNIVQEYPFHYIEKSFLTDEVVMLYEEKMLRLLR